MKITSVFRRRLKTARHLVFENIMDLDHVCVVHKRWFGNLRATTRKPDYVEYRLDSFFYGLKQQILARGGPVNEDLYWYEFIGSLARIRVNGVMEGADGELTLTETITYEFAWLFAPLFWLMQPFFKRQKQDILLADSRLLERAYQLEQRDFKRLARPARRKRVVVFGGSGFFGRLVVEDLLKGSEAEIVVAARHIGTQGFHPYESRVLFVESEINDYASVLTTIEGADVAICCVGPFQGLSLNLLRACIEKRVHYVDVADDCDFVMRCHEMRGEIERAGIMAFVGCSVVPGISSLLARYCQQRIQDHVDTIRVFISPGTRHPRGRGSFLCLLSTVGSEFSIPRGGRQETITGWTGREKVRFPTPMGERWVYFVVDIADYFLHPKQFGAETVEFKIGSEIDLLNRSLAAVGWLKKKLGVSSLDGFAPLFRVLIGLASPFGTTRGGMMVEATANRDSMQTSAKMSVFAESHGEIIPALLPSIATQMILSGEAHPAGIVPLANWLPEEQFARELANRGVRLAIDESDTEDWQLLTTDKTREILAVG